MQKYSSFEIDSILRKNLSLSNIENGYSTAEAQEIALLSMYGDVINFFKSGNTENLDFKLIVILPNPNNTYQRKVRAAN